MCNHDPDGRIQAFSEIDREMQQSRFFEIGFTDAEMAVYRSFADKMESHVTKVERDAKYQDDMDRAQTALENVYRTFMLEETVPESSAVLKCFVHGAYYYKKKGFPVAVVRDFVHLLKSSSPEQKRVILLNLHTRLNSIVRYKEPELDDCPF